MVLIVLCQLFTFETLVLKETGLKHGTEVINVKSFWKTLTFILKIEKLLILIWLKMTLVTIK